MYEKTVSGSCGTTGFGPRGPGAVERYYNIRLLPRSLITTLVGRRRLL